MRKKYTKKSAPTDWLGSQVMATSALLKFCEDHNYDSEDLINLKACKQALDNKAINKAVEEYKKIPLGGNGCFNDWWPNVVYEHETSEYLKVVFQSLVEHWSRLMHLSVDALNA